MHNESKVHNHTYQLTGVEGEFSYIAVGCGGTAEVDQKRVAAAIYDKIASMPFEQRPKFIALLGDNVYDHGVPRADHPDFVKYFYEIYQRIYKDFNIPIFNIIGNHGYSYDNHTLAKRKLPGGEQKYPWGPERAQNLVEHATLATTQQTEVIQDYIKHYTDVERMTLNNGNEFALAPDEKVKPLPMYNMPHNFYKLQAGKQHFFFLDTNVYLNDWLALQDDWPADEEKRDDYLKQQMQAGNQAAWFQLKFQALRPDDKVTLMQHHPLLSRGKRGDPAIKSDLGLYMHNRDDRERLRNCLDIKADDFARLTVNDLLLHAYQKQEIVGNGKRITVNCAHAHTQYHVSDDDLGIDQTVSGGGGGELQHGFYPHKVSSGEYSKRVAGKVSEGLSQSAAEEKVDKELLLATKKTKFFADSFGFALHHVSTDGKVPHEIAVLAMDAVDDGTRKAAAVYKLRESNNTMEMKFDDEDDVLELRTILIEAVQAYISFQVRLRPSWACPAWINKKVWGLLCAAALMLRDPLSTHSEKGKKKALAFQKTILNHAAMNKDEIMTLLSLNFAAFFHDYDKYTFLKPQLYQHSFYMFIDQACYKKYGQNLKEFVRLHTSQPELKLLESKESTGKPYVYPAFIRALLTLVSGWQALNFLSNKAEESHAKGEVGKYFVCYLAYVLWLPVVVLASASSFLTSICSLLSERIIGYLSDYCYKKFIEDYKASITLGIIAWGAATFVFCLLYYTCRQIFSVRQSADDAQHRIHECISPYVSEQTAARVGRFCWGASLVISMVLITVASAILLPYIAPAISSLSVVFWFQHFVHWQALTHLLNAIANFIGPIISVIARQIHLSHILPSTVVLPRPFKNVFNISQGQALEIVSPTMFAANSVAIFVAEKAEQAEKNAHIQPDNMSAPAQSMQGRSILNLFINCF